MSEDENCRARAIGGVFFRSADPEATRDWYGKHLGLNINSYGTDFEWRHADKPEKSGYTHWGPFKQDTDYFGSKDQQFMINYRVDDLEALVEKLRTEGVKIIDEIESEDYGKFIHIEDNDGRRVELWEPADDEYRKILDDVTS